MQTKTLRDFIREHRAEIDRAVIGQLTRYDKPGFTRDLPAMNDEERRQWILNDEGLYNWARSEGVNC